MDSMESIESVLLTPFHHDLSRERHVDFQSERRESAGLCGNSMFKDRSRKIETLRLSRSGSSCVLLTVFQLFLPPELRMVDPIEFLGFT